MRREYAGAARKARLAAPLGGSAVDLGILGDDLTGWPTGAGGPFFVVIGRGTPSEEKILCESRTGNSLTVYTDGVINGRGADGTTIVSHDFNDFLEHVHTATDADEANEHVNSTANVHGVTSDLVGVDDTQTLTNKSIDGNANTLTNIPQAAVTGLVADIADIEAVNATQTTNITNVTNANIATQAEVDALEIVVATKAPINNPTFTGTVTLPATTSIGNVTGSEIANLDGTVTNLQTQINAITGGGVAVPPGGLTDEILVKLSDNDYDMAWKPLSYLMYIPGSGTGDEIVPDGQIIGGTKTSWTDTNTGFIYNIHTFNYSNLYEWGVYVDYLTVNTPVVGMLLVVAGGGSGGRGGTFAYGGGGGGGGGVFYGPYAFGLGQHNLIVGKGGIANNQSGGDSRFDDMIVKGGGYGGVDQGAGASGGSGGGGSGATWGGPGGGSVNFGSGYLTQYHYGSPGGSGGVGWSGSGGSANLTTALFGGTPVTYGTGGVGAASESPLSGTNGLGEGGQGKSGQSGGVGGNGGHGVIKVRYRIA